MVLNAGLAIRSLSITIGTFSLRDVDLEVPAGGYCMILGPSGAGKTILLETIAGIYTPQKGEISIDGRDITRNDPKDREIAMVYQDCMLFPHLTVRENIAFGLKQRDVSPGEIEERVHALADLTGIVQILDRYTDTLSGGEQQRTAIARGLVLSPRILLLDEPLSALDTMTRDLMRKELKRIHQATGTTILHITHHYEDVYDLAEQVAVLQEGRIVQSGTAEEIFRTPATEFVARFVGHENMVRCSPVSGNGTTRLEIPGVPPIYAAVPAETGRDIIAVIPQADIALSRRPPPDTVNTRAGTVTALTSAGGIVRVVVDTGFPMTVHLTRQQCKEARFNIGDAVFASFSPGAVHLIPLPDHEQT